MKYKVQLESEKGMSEKQVRDSIDRAANMARQVSIQKGERDQGHDAYRKRMVENAQRDKKDGKI